MSGQERSHLPHGMSKRKRKDKEWARSAKYTALIKSQGKRSSKKGVRHGDLQVNCAEGHRTIQKSRWTLRLPVPASDGITYLPWWGCSHQLMSSQSLTLHLLRLLHLFLQGLPPPLVQSPPLLLSPSRTSQTWLLYPRKRNCNKARRLHALGNWEPVKNSYTGHPGRTLCGFWVSINYRHTEKARRDQLHCDRGSMRTGGLLWE